VALALFDLAIGRQFLNFTVMDFDDLLADPFEDPFAKPRSGSPDPWATFSHQTAVSSESQDAFAQSYNSGYEENRSTTPTTASYATGDPGEGSQSSLVDPLEAATVNAEEEDSSGPTSPRTPGFRESIDVLNPADHTQTIAEPEPSTPPTKTLTPPPAAAHPPPTSVAKTPSPPSSPNLDASHSRSSPKVISPIVSPLERPLASSNIDHSFAGLALGGESIGGWQTDQGSWVNDHQSPLATSNVGSATEEEDDDDDDEPIMKSRRVGTDSSNAVSSFYSGLVLAAENMSHKATTRNDTGIQPVFIISVDDPQKVGDPIRSFTMYTVHTRVSHV
jgi:sorting nexin-1/2